MSKVLSFDEAYQIYVKGETNNIKSDEIDMSLIKNVIRKECISLAAILISKYTKVNVINLNDTGLTDFNFAIILESIVDNKFITRLECSFNKLTNDSIKYFTTKVSNNRFASVSIRHNRMTSEAKKIVAEWMIGSTNSITIELGINKNQDYDTIYFKKLNSVMVNKKEYEELKEKEEELKQLKEKIAKLIP